MRTLTITLTCWMTTAFLIEDEGLEIWDIQAVQVEAARSFFDMARDALRKPALQSMERISIQVRDEAGAVMNVPFTFEIDRKKLRAVLFNGRAHDRSGPRIAYIAP